MFKFNPPTNRMFFIALAAAAISVAARFFIAIPFLGNYTYEILLGAYVLLMLSCVFKGL